MVRPRGMRSDARQPRRSHIETLVDTSRATPTGLDATKLCVGVAVDSGKVY